MRSYRRNNQRKELLLLLQHLGKTIQIPTWEEVSAVGDKWNKACNSHLCVCVCAVHRLEPRVEFNCTRGTDLSTPRLHHPSLASRFFCPYSEASLTQWDHHGRMSPYGQLGCLPDAMMVISMLDGYKSPERTVVVYARQPVIPWMYLRCRLR